MPRLSFIPTACLLLVAICVSGNTVADDADVELRERLARLIDGYHQVHGFAGTVLVMHQEQTVLDHSVGLAERSFGIAHSANTRHSLNSISKTFTATAVLRLAERKALDLHAPISRYLPDLKSPWAAQVTAHHLLSHTSGLPREAGLESHQSLSLEQQLPYVAALDIAFKPGTEYGYSNAGYILLGLLLERVTGADYAAIIEREILTPLQLKETGVYRGRNVVERQATPYRLTPDGVVAAQRTKTLGESGGGGLYSTAGDLYRYVRALEDDSLLGAEPRQLLFKGHIQSAGEDYEAYAWSIKRFGEQTLRFAAGSGYGAKSVMIRNPDQGLFVAILSNWGNTPILQILRDVFLSLNGETVAPPTHQSLARPADYQTYMGRYAFDPDELRQSLQIEDSVIRVHEFDGKLFMNEELLAQGENGELKLTYTDELLIRFEQKRMIITINGRQLIGQRGTVVPAHSQ
ncbi:MAG: hypothetical protein Tsb002_33610 [Wenzhouxiangellaceae bacterium]